MRDALVEHLEGGDLAALVRLVEGRLQKLLERLGDVLGEGEGEGEGEG